MYYEQRTSVLDVNENSKEITVTLKGNNGGLGDLMEDLVSTQIAISFTYMAEMASDFAGTPGTPSFTRRRVRPPPEGD